MAITVSPECVTTWEYMTDEEQKFFMRHHREIREVARYAEAVGKTEITIVPDDSEGEEVVRGFRAVRFRCYADREEIFTARSVFDVQYYTQ